MPAMTDTWHAWDVYGMLQLPFAPSTRFALCRAAKQRMFVQAEASVYRCMPLRAVHVTDVLVVMYYMCSTCQSRPPSINILCELTPGMFLSYICLVHQDLFPCQVCLPNQDIFPF